MIGSIGNSRKMKIFSFMTRPGCFITKHFLVCGFSILLVIVPGTATLSKNVALPFSTFVVYGEQKKISIDVSSRWAS